MRRLLAAAKAAAKLSGKLRRITREHMGGQAQGIADQAQVVLDRGLVVGHQRGGAEHGELARHPARVEQQLAPGGLVGRAQVGWQMLQHVAVVRHCVPGAAATGAVAGHQGAIQLGQPDRA